MDRFQNTDLSSTPPEPTTGETGYLRQASPGNYEASAVYAWYFHMLVEELRNVVLANPDDPTPVYTALNQVQASIAAQINAATPDGTETVKGLVRFATEEEHVDGESDELACNPAGVKAMIADSLAGGSQATVVLTSSGTYTVPAGVFAIEVECVGVGGSGGNQGSGSAGKGGGGGGAGGYARKRYSVTPEQEIAYTITGVATTFNGTLVANAGGAGEAGSLRPGLGGIGGTASGGDINIKGGDGSIGGEPYVDADTQLVGYGGTGGSCPVGFGARSGTAGAAYGGGGGGGGSGVGPGAGGPGAVIIREIS